MKRDDLLTEVVAGLRARSGFSLGLQETWRTGVEEITEDGYTFLGAAPDEQDSRRGVCGVGLLLSPLATSAWKAAGPDNLHNDLGPRIIAVRMMVEDANKQQLGIFQVAAYAPTSTAPREVQDAYEAALSEVIARRTPSDILIICADINASIGRGCLDGHNGYTAVGPHGIDHMNEAGRRLRSFLELHDLAALSTFFKKKHYGTWQHPRSKLQHHLDHIIVSRRDLKRFTDAGCCYGQLIDSDHSAVRCKLRFSARLRRKPADPRARVCKLDFAPLRERNERGVPENACVFAQKVVDRLDSDPCQSTYPALADALYQTAVENLSRTKPPGPRWFQASESVLLYSISDRNSAFHAYLRTPTPDTKRRYQQARAAAQYEVRRAKSAWIADMCSNVNEGWFGSSDGGKRAWDTIKILKAGLTPPRRPPQRRDGSIASSPEEIAEVFHQHFTDLYGRTPQWDPTVLDDMPQIPVSPDDGLPSDDEICRAIKKLHGTGPGNSGLHARLWQALELGGGIAGLDHIRQCIWTSGSTRKCQLPGSLAC